LTVRDRDRHGAIVGHVVPHRGEEVQVGDDGHPFRRHAEDPSVRGRMVGLGELEGDDVGAGRQSVKGIAEGITRPFRKI